MSYPGSMSRGKSPIVKKGTKKELEKYFTEKFPIADIWNDAEKVAQIFESWHRDRVSEMAQALKLHVCGSNDPESVNAKFLNTFMHQLMKYEEARPLWRKLHLPLDRRVLDALAKQKSEVLPLLKATSSPYTMSYARHLQFQDELWKFISELNKRPKAEFQIQSRIELNLLWL